MIFVRKYHRQLIRISGVTFRSELLVAPTIDLAHLASLAVIDLIGLDDQSNREDDRQDDDCDVCLRIHVLTSF